MEKGQVWRQFIVAGIANIAMLSIGCCMGWTSPVNVKLLNATLSPLPAPITGDQGAWIGSLLTVGAVFGPFIAGFLAPRIGRKWSVMCCAIPLLIGWILVGIAHEIEFIYAGRVLWGIGAGMLFAASPMYCAEIATDAYRGAVGSFLQVFITVGFLLVYAIGPYIAYVNIAYVGVAILAVFVISFLFMPESPFYHLTRNDKESAAQCLMMLRGRSRAGVESELLKMEDNVRTSMEKTANIADVFRARNLKALCISCAMISFQQFSGVNAVLFNLTAIFNAAGSDLDPAVSTIIVGAVQVVASLITPFVVDRLGRRVLLLVSTFGTAVALGLLGVYFILDSIQSPAASTLSFLPLFSLMLFIITYCWGLGPVPFIIMTEFSSTEVKSVAVPMVTAYSWILMFLVTRLFEPVARTLGMYAVFWMFGVFCVAGFLFTLLVVPETKGKSFQQIQDILAGRKKESKDRW